MQNIFIVSVLILFNSLLSNATERKYADHLIPPVSYLDEVFFIDTETLKVTKEKLQKDFPYWSSAKYYCLPSFEGAFAFAIYEERDYRLNLSLDEDLERKETVYFLISNHLDRSFTEFRRTGTIEGKSSKRGISKELVELIGKIWTEGLKECRFPDDSEYVPEVIDGDSHYFSTNATWGLKSGFFHSPFQRIQPNLFELVRKAKEIFLFAIDETASEEDLKESLTRNSHKLLEMNASL